MAVQKLTKGSVQGLAKRECMFLRIFVCLMTFRNITAVIDAIVIYNKFKNIEQVHDS